MKSFLFALLMFFFLSPVFSQTAYTVEDREVKTEKPVPFKTGSAVLLPEADEALNIIKQYLDDKKYISKLRVEAHSDNEADQKLTEQRALAVCKRLVELGVDCKRLIAAGFGNTQPVADNSSPEGKAQNRRINFINVALKGTLIAGMQEDGFGVIAGDPCK